MNKFFALLAVVLIAVTSCDGQKASERERGKEVTDSVTIRKVAYTKPYSSATPEVQVQMNGVPFKMLWDTGATVTVISSQELAQLLKEGVVSDADLIGEARVTVADGSTHKVPVLSIRELTIRTNGEPYIVNNVQVTVVTDPNASLLLGQNVMKELPDYSINEIDQTFEFKDK